MDRDLIRTCVSIYIAMGDHLITGAAVPVPVPLAVIKHVYIALTLRIAGCRRQHHGRHAPGGGRRHRGHCPADRRCLPR